MLTAKMVMRKAIRALIPPPKIDLADWIETEVRLPDGVSALSGPVRLWPFQREMATVMGDSIHERVTVLKAARIGYTTLLTSTIAGFVANDPSPILAVLPTESDCRDYMVSDVEPIFAATPAVARMLAKPESTGPKSGPSADDRSTMMSRRFPGGSLKVVAAKSPRNLRRHNARVVILDEIDGMEVTKEGPPVLLAEKRTLSFPNRKIIKGSTPVFTETSEVIRSYAESDARVFEIPCPQCGEFFELMWEHIQWPEGRHAEAYAVCPHGCVIEERLKGEAVTNGRWRATRPEVVGHAGFRLNALVSLHANAAWGKLALEWRAAQKSNDLKQVFINTILGQGWDLDGTRIDDADLATRAKPFGLETMPADVLVITAGLDVQRSPGRVEITIIGHSETGKVYVLGHAIVWGEANDTDTWEEVDAVLAQRWAHPLGGKIGITAAAVDSSDGETSKTVLAFCHARSKRKIVAIKGVPGFTKLLMERSKSAISKVGHLWLVGADTGKRKVFDLLPREDLIEFSVDLSATWFEQVTGERLVIRYDRGRPVPRFEGVVGRRNEALDCLVYALAAFEGLVNPNWSRIKDDVSRDEPIRTPKAPRITDPEWLKSSGSSWL